MRNIIPILRGIHQNNPSRRRVIERMLVEYEFVTEEGLKDKLLQTTIDNWVAYVSLPNEDTERYFRLKVTLVQLFGASWVEWIVNNTFALHQITWLRKKGMSLSKVLRESPTRV